MCRFHVDSAQFKRDREKAERAVRKLKQAEPQSVSKTKTLSKSPKKSDLALACSMFGTTDQKSV